MDIGLYITFLRQPAMSIRFEVTDYQKESISFIHLFMDLPLGRFTSTGLQSVTLPAYLLSSMRAIHVHV